MTQQIAQQRAEEFEKHVEEICKSPKRHLIIDIETDSTIRADVSRDIEQFNGLITATSNFAAALAGLGPILPQTVPPLFKVFASQARKFRLGSEGEDALDELMEAAKHPPTPQNAAPGVSEQEVQENDKQRAHEEKMETMKQQSAHAKQQGDVEKIQAQVGAKQEEVGISQQQSQVDNANADKQLERDVILTKVQGEAGVAGEQAKQQGASALQDKKHAHGMAQQQAKAAQVQPQLPMGGF
jgi:hypothetical protein